MKFETEDVLLDLMLTGMFQVRRRPLRLPRPCPTTHPLPFPQLVTHSSDCVEPEVSLLHPTQSTTLAAASPLGLFVRQCVVSFASLSFEAVCGLHARCVAYVAGHEGPFSLPVAMESDMMDTRGTSSVLRPYAEALLVSAPGALSWPRPGTWSAALDTRPAEELCHPVQRLCDHVDRAGGAPGDARAFVQHLSDAAPHTAATQAVRCAIACATHDVPVAMDTLHALPELGMPGQSLAASVRGGPSGVIPPSDHAAFPPRAPGFAAAAGSAIRAQISLAAFHVREGHMEAGLALLDATVRVAHTANDSASLAHALGLMCQLLMRCDHGGKEEEVAGLEGDAEGWQQQWGHPTASGPTRRIIRLTGLIRRCAHLARGLNLPALSCWAHLAEAQLACKCGAASSPHVAQLAHAACIQTAFQAAIAVRVSQPAAPAKPPPGGPAAAAQGQTGGASHLFASATTASTVPMLGAPGAGPRGDTLATATGAPAASQVAAAHRAAATSALVLAAAWRGVGAPDVTAAHVASFLSTHGDSEHVTMDDVALAHSLQVAVLADTQSADAARAALAAALNALAPRLPYVVRGAVLGVPAPLRDVCCALQHSDSLATRRLRDADALCVTMAGLAPSRSILDPEVALNVRLACAATRLACGDCTQAAAHATAVSRKARTLCLNSHRCRALLLQCDAHAAAGDVLRAISLACEASALAARMKATTLMAEACVAQCELHATRGLQAACSQAVKDLTDALPFLAGHAPLGLRGRGHMALARAQLGALTSLEALCGSPAAMEEVQRNLQAAQTAWLAAGDAHRAAQAAHLAAFVYHACGDTRRRDEAAARALALAGSRSAADGQLLAFALGSTDWALPPPARSPVGFGRA